MAGKQPGQKQTPQQKAMAEVAVQQLQDFRARRQPLQTQLADTIVKAGQRDSFERQRASGMATTDTAAQFGQAQEKLREGTEAAGLGGSAKQKLGIAGLGDDQAMSAGFGLANADQMIDEGYVQGLGNLMALGRGEKAQAMQGIGQMAQLSGQRAASDASMALAERAGQAQVAGQALGIGMSQAFGPSGPNPYTTPNSSGAYANPGGSTYAYQGATLPNGLRAGG